MSDHITIRVWEDGYKELVGNNTTERPVREGVLSSKLVVYVLKEEGEE